MAYSANKQEMFTRKYLQRWLATVGQTASKFDIYVNKQTGLQGELIRALKMGSREMNSATFGVGDTPNNQSKHEARWLAPQLFDDGEIIPKGFDLFSENADGYITKVQDEMAKAAKRKIDQVILGAALKPARSGPNGATMIAFPASQQIPVDFVAEGTATPSPITFDKIIEARTKIEESDGYMDGDTLVMALSPRDANILLRDERATNAQIAEVKALINGDVGTIMGFTIIKTNMLPVTDGVRSCIAWNKKAIELGVWADAKFEQTIRADKKNAPQLYATMTIDAVRCYEEQVVEILCKAN